MSERKSVFWCGTISKKVLEQIICTYKMYWNQWYCGQVFKPAKLKIIEFNECNVDSGYDPKKDIIRLCISEDTIPTELDILELWPLWKKELIHEMIHEYQYKVIKGKISDEGRRFHRIYRNTFFGEGHEEDFFTAIEIIRCYLDVDMKLLIKTI